MQPRAMQPAKRKKVASAWFAGWHADEGFDVNDIPWLKYTEVTFAFA